MLRARISSFGRNTAFALRQRLAPPRYVIAELRPSNNTPTKGAPTLRKDRHPRTRLLQAIHTGMKTTDGHENIISMVKESLDTYIPRIKQPQYSYETVIRFLLSRNCLPAVISVYERMTDVGYAVSLRLEAKMIVALIVGTTGVGEKVVEEWWGSLQGIVRNPGFGDEDLWNVLQVMSNRDFPSDLLLTTMNNFYDSHKAEDSKPDMRLYKRFLHRGVEKGQVEAGLRSLAVLGHSQLRGPKRKLVNQAYAAFIAGVRDAPYPDRNVIGAALKMMEEQGVQPSIVVVNALISLEVLRNSLHRAFALYHSVKHDRNLWPDDFTFGSLFNILNRLYNPKRRRVRHGRVIITGDIPSPRMLYREMMEALLRKRTGLAFEPTTSLLNVVLRSFVYKNDYVGACVVLQCFTAFRVPVNVVTYKFVFAHLMNRITYWIRAYRKMGDDKWGDRFLSLPYPMIDPEFLVKLKLGVPLMVRMLDVSRRREFYLDWPLFAHRWQNHYASVPVEYKVPSVEYLEGKIPVSLDYGFDVVPLERLLRKAILCEVDSMRELGYGEAAVEYIAKAIAEVKAEMVPAELDRRLEEMERQREVEKQRKVVENKLAKGNKQEKEVFEGFTERRKRRHAERGKAEGVTMVVKVGGPKKGVEERQEGAELADGVVDEARINVVAEDEGRNFAIAVVNATGMRSAIWVNQVAREKRRAKKWRRNANKMDRMKNSGGLGGGVKDS